MSDWTKVSDKAPPYGRPVLTWHPKAEHRIMTMTRDGDDERDVWWCSMDTDNRYMVVHAAWAPTHWRPLPEPPQEDEP